MNAPLHHHPFCNGPHSAPVETCHWCGKDGLDFWRKYPADGVRKPPYDKTTETFPATIHEESE